MRTQVLPNPEGPQKDENCELLYLLGDRDSLLFLGSFLVDGKLCVRDERQIPNRANSL